MSPPGTNALLERGIDATLMRTSSCAPERRVRGWSGMIRAARAAFQHHAPPYARAAPQERCVRFSLAGLVPRLPLAAVRAALRVGRAGAADRRASAASAAGEAGAVVQLVAACVVIGNDDLVRAVGHRGVHQGGRAVRVPQ